METHQTQKREANVNWDALENDTDFSDKAVVTQEIEIKDDSDINEIKSPEEKKEESKADVVEEPEEKKEGEVTEEKKPEDEVKPDAKTEVKDEEVAEIKELTLENVKGFEKSAEDGTWMAVGEGLGVKPKDDTFESFQEAIEGKYKSQIEEAKKIGIEQVYSTLKPETVTALKLMEMGIPQEEAFNPTAGIDGYLKLTDTELVRANLESLEGWDSDRVDLEMESLSANEAKLKHEALKIREGLNYNKIQINERREALLNEYTQNKEKVAIEQKNQELTQIKTALDGVGEFMGAKINPEAKSAILQKHSRGDYGSVLKDPKAIAEFIYYKEFGTTIFENAKKSSYNKGKLEYANKMLNIPVKQGEVAQKIAVEKTPNQLKNNFSALDDEFGK